MSKLTMSGLEEVVRVLTVDELACLDATMTHEAFCREENASIRKHEPVG